MIKKFKNWYNNLLSFQKIRFWQVVLSITAYFLTLYLWILNERISILFPCIFLGPIIAMGVASAIALLFRPDTKKTTYELKKMYKDSEDKINVWFVSSNCVKVNIQYNEDSAEIISYYRNKNLLVNAFYIERSMQNNKTIYYILADCEGKQDKMVFPEKIE